MAATSEYHMFPVATLAHIDRMHMAHRDNRAAAHNLLVQVQVQVQLVPGLEYSPAELVVRHQQTPRPKAKRPSLAHMPSAAHHKFVAIAHTPLALLAAAVVAVDNRIACHRRVR